MILNITPLPRDATPLLVYKRVLRGLRFAYFALESRPNRIDNNLLREDLESFEVARIFTRTNLELFATRTPQLAITMTLHSNTYKFHAQSCDFAANNKSHLRQL